MKVLHNSKQNLQVQAIATDLVAGVAEIFAQHPTLCAFSVQDRSTLTKDRANCQLHGNWYLADVSVNSWLGFHVTREYCNQIACKLLELMDEQPDAFVFLHGCTFARTLH